MQNTHCMVDYLREHVVLPGPSVEIIKGFTNPSPGHFTTSFSGLQAALQLRLGRHVNSVSYCEVQSSFNAVASNLHCEFILQWLRRAVSLCFSLNCVYFLGLFFHSLLVRIAYRSISLSRQQKLKSRDSNLQSGLS